MRFYLVNISRMLILVALSCNGNNSIHIASAQDDIPKLVFGMSTALSGPAAELGMNMRLGVTAAFSEVNRNGGIRGHQLDLIVLDDGYEPSRTAPNMHSLIDQYRVLGIIGNVGTPTAITAMPIAQRAQTPFFGAFTGASALRKQTPDRFVINYRASYAQETAAMVDALIESGVKPEEIGFFTQNDSFGDDGFFGGFSAILKHKTISQSTVAHGRYARNTNNIESGLAELLMHDPLPKAVIMVGTYAPCSKLIFTAKQNAFEPLFLGVSFVGSDALLRTLGEEANGVAITQVVPHFDSDIPLATRYRKAIDATEDKAGYSFGSMEGYTAAVILIRALQQIEGDFTRQSITSALEALGEFDIGLGVPLSLSEADHQASNSVWPVVIRDNLAAPIHWKELVERIDRGF